MNHAQITAAVRDSEQLAATTADRHGTYPVRVLLGDRRPLPTRSTRCERCGHPAYLPAQPEEQVLCGHCLGAPR